MITCVVNYESGYWIGLILTPILLFVVETGLRYSWHALSIGWKLGCDHNGDFEALDATILKKVIRKLKRETRGLLRAKAKEYDRLHEKSKRAFAKIDIIGTDSQLQSNGAQTISGEPENTAETPNITPETDISDLFRFDSTAKAVKKHKSVIVGPRVGLFVGIELVIKPQTIVIDVIIIIINRLAIEFTIARVELGIGSQYTAIVIIIEK